LKLGVDLELLSSSLLHHFLPLPLLYILCVFISIGWFSFTLSSLCSDLLLSVAAVSVSISISISMGDPKSRSTDQWILEWKEMLDNDAEHPKLVNSINEFFTNKEYEKLVLALSKEHARIIMVDLLKVNYLTGDFKNRTTRLITIRNTLADLLRDSDNEEEQNDEEEDNKGVEQEAGDNEAQEDGDGLVRSGKDEVSTPTRARRHRKVKDIAADREFALALSDRDVINNFSRRVNNTNLKPSSKKETKLRKANSKKKEKPKSRIGSGDRDSSDDDSDSSEDDSDLDSDSHSSDSSSSDSDVSSSDSSSSSDSDDDDVSKRKSKVGKREKRKHIRHLKRKRGSRLAEYMWNKSHGHVKRSLMKFDYKNKRNQYEVLLLASVFDSIMKMKCIKLYDKPMRLIASRIAALQSYELTGSWEVADQFGEDSVHNGLISRKQLNTAVKSAESIKKVLGKISNPKGNPAGPTASKDPIRPHVPPLVGNQQRGRQEQGPSAPTGGPRYQ
jgi:hypothetical protein